MLIDTHEVTTRAGVTRGQLLAWRRRRLVRPLFRVGDQVLTEAEAEARYPGSLSWPLWSEDDVERVRLLGHLTRGPYAMTADGAGRLLDDLAVRKTSTTGRAEPVVLLAPGITVRRSVCACVEDCDPFRAEVLAAQHDLRPVLDLAANVRPVVAL